MLTRILAVISSIVMFCGCVIQDKPVRFAVIADVQYADKDNAAGRYYRNSLAGLEKFVRETNSASPDFAIELGDIIEGGSNAGAELEQVLKIYNALICPRYFVLGNHEFNGLERKTVLAQKGMQNGYYSFDYGNRRFIVLDTLELGVQGGWPKNSEQYKKSEAMLSRMILRNEPNAQPYNGGVTQEQLDWIDSLLTNADQRSMDVIVLGHLPLLPPADKHTAWNALDIRQTFEKHGCVRAYICGHNHAGGYCRENGIHYLTLQSMVDDPDGNTWAMMRIYPDRMEIVGTGNIENKILSFGN